MTNTISLSAIMSSTAISYVNTAHNYGVSGDMPKNEYTLSDVRKITAC